MKKYIRNIIIVVVVCAIAATAILTFATPSNAANNNVPTAAAQQGTLTASVNTAGNIAPVQALNMNFGQAGTVQTVSVTVGDSVKAGQVLAKLDPTQLNLALQNAQANLKNAQDKLAQDKNPNTPQDIASAKSAADAAEANYQNMTAPPTQADLTSAQQSVASAQAAYNAAIKTASTGNDTLNADAAAVQTAQAAMQQAQAAYDKVASQANIAMLPQSLTLQQDTIAYQQAVANYQALQTTQASSNNSTVQQAQSQLATAMDSLAKIEKPYTPQQIQQALDQAAEAQDTYQKMLAGSTQETLDEDQNAVTQAQVTVKQAQLAVQQTQIVAPFAGVVTAVNITPGQDTFTTETTPDLQIADLSHLEVVVAMAETDVVNVKTGQTAQVQLSALPNVPVSGTVTLVSPYGTLTQGVVNYPVTISLNNPPAGVEAGMSANINVITRQVSSALYVPNRAVHTVGQQKTVTVLYQGQQIQVPVTTGLTNDSYTQITSGTLKAGDQVVTSTTATPTSTGARPGGPGGPGGRFLGGGL